MKFGTFFQVLGSALTISALLSLPAQAGRNGQQLSITSYGVRRITVSGPNQNGQRLTWSSSADGALVNRTFRTNNWWWQGTVTIVVIRDGSSQICYVNVPKVQLTSDWVGTNCGARTLVR
jgi:hypothetical protein